MNRIGLLMLLLGLLSVGCLPRFLRTETRPPQVQMAIEPPPTVTEDAVNEQNADECASALRDELEFDMNKAKAPKAAPGKK